MNTLSCDVLVIGAGSGGIGAAVGAAEKGARVVLADAHQTPGGVVAHAWVHNWEPTCGSGPLARRLWAKMRSYDLGASNVAFTTSRNGADGKRLHTMPFELWAYLRAVQNELKRLEVRFMPNMNFIGAESNGGKISSSRFISNGVPVEIRAKSFIDSTGNLTVARSLGCECMIGSDSCSTFGEADAPVNGDGKNLNRVNWIYRIRRGVSAPRPPSDEPLMERANIRGFFHAEMPNGDWLINICGIGQYDPADPLESCHVMAEQYRLAQDTFYHLTRTRFPDWQLIGMAPEMGIRETWRLKARNIMTETDVFEGGKRYADRFVAMTDHPLDIHGTDLEKLGAFAYGIDYFSLLSREFNNLWIGGRGIGTTHIVAGSCGLSRTVMTYGEAAGRAAALCAQRDMVSDKVEIAEISDFEHVQY